MNNLTEFTLKRFWFGADHYLTVYLKCNNLFSEQPLFLDHNYPAATMFKVNRYNICAPLGIEVEANS